MHHGRNVVHHALVIMHSGGIWANMFLSFLIIYYALCIMSISTVFVFPEGQFQLSYKTWWYGCTGSGGTCMNTFYIGLYE
jgi:hypothetical protein